MRTGPLAFACLIALAAALPAARAPAQPACKQTAAGTATLAQVRDGRTLLLGDGRELRLAAIEPSSLGRAVLQELAAGHELRIETIGAGHDRYGRLTGFVFAGKAARSLQVALLGVRRGSLSRSAIAPARRRCWRPSRPRAPRNSGCGPIPISPLWRQKVCPDCKRGAANLH
jgi:hypothetical protein